jgi:choline dehydrogenase-like flavoprotein
VVSRTSDFLSISTDASDILPAGASGCVVASRLANTPEKPSVLLLEAGGSNQSAADLSGTERFKLAFTPGSPYNWSYETTPQHQLVGQTIDYSRGKGLGGSTAINFCGWTVGARDDFEEYAALVGNERFGWENVRKCLRQIERVHLGIPDEQLRKYVNAKAEGMRPPY